MLCISLYDGDPWKDDLEDLNCDISFVLIYSLDNVYANFDYVTTQAIASLNMNISNNTLAAMRIASLSKSFWFLVEKTGQHGFLIC